MEITSSLPNIKGLADHLTVEVPSTINHMLAEPVADVGAAGKKVAKELEGRLADVKRPPRNTDGAADWEEEEGEDGHIVGLVPVEVNVDSLRVAFDFLAKSSDPDSCSFESELRESLEETKGHQLATKVAESAILSIELIQPQLDAWRDSVPSVIREQQEAMRSQSVNKIQACVKELQFCEAEHDKRRVHERLLQHNCELSNLLHQQVGELTKRMSKDKEMEITEARNAVHKRLEKRKEKVEKEVRELNLDKLCLEQQRAVVATYLDDKAKEHRLALESKAKVEAETNAKIDEIIHAVWKSYGGFSEHLDKTHQVNTEFKRLQAEVEVAEAEVARLDAIAEKAKTRLTATRKVWEDVQRFLGHLDAEAGEVLNAIDAKEAEFCKSLETELTHSACCCQKATTACETQLEAFERKYKDDLRILKRLMEAKQQNLTLALYSDDIEKCNRCEAKLKRQRESEAKVQECLEDVKNGLNTMRSIRDSCARCVGNATAHDVKAASDWVQAVVPQSLKSDDFTINRGVEETRI